MTSQPISSISYNTELFLKEKLDELLKNHVIQAYMYIVHIGEDGDKDHIHFRIEPNRRIDPMDLTEFFKEPDSTRSDGKMLGIRPWRMSREEDWFLYAVHDKEYLNLKYQGGDPHEKIAYDWHHIVVNDGYDLEVAFIRAKSSLMHNSASMAKRLLNGEKAINLILEGENVHTVNAIKQSLVSNDYDRLQNAYNGISLRWNQAKKFFLEYYEIDIDSLFDDLNEEED